MTLETISWALLALSVVCESNVRSHEIIALCKESYYVLETRNCCTKAAHNIFIFFSKRFRTKFNLYNELCAPSKRTKIIFS